MCLLTPWRRGERGHHSHRRECGEHLGVGQREEQQAGRAEEVEDEHGRRDERRREAELGRAEALLVAGDRHRIDDAGDAVRDGGDLGARQGRADLWTGREAESVMDVGRGARVRTRNERRVM